MKFDKNYLATKYEEETTMKTMRRIVTLLLALVMTAGLAACGGGGSGAVRLVGCFSGESDFPLAETIW